MSLAHPFRALPPPPSPEDGESKLPSFVVTIKISMLRWSEVGARILESHYPSSSPLLPIPRKLCGAFFLWFCLILPS